MTTTVAFAPKEPASLEETGLPESTKHSSPPSLSSLLTSAGSEGRSFGKLSAAFECSTICDSQSFSDA
jgi:hypothetical protein